MRYRPLTYGLGCLLALALLAASSGAPAQADLPDFPLGLLERGLSHLAPHLFPPPERIPAEALLPVPPALLTPLQGEEPGLTKGLDPFQEQVIVSALLALPLRQRLLKVAVAEAQDKRLALIKFQAGDAATGRFRVEDLQEDAVSALRVAFALPLDLDRVDLWSVVPGRDRDGPVHTPVFSVSTNRAQFLSAAQGPKAAKEILGDLGLVRFAPKFLKYAGGEDLQKVAPHLPRTAWSISPLADNWSQLLSAAGADPRLPLANVARVVVRLPAVDNSVALTVDDGPHPLITSLFLETLKRYNVRATFFVVGEKVEECPELLRRLAEEGHELGNHTYSHPRLHQVTPVEALAQIRACGEVVGRVCGQPMHLLRPPGGRITRSVLQAATAGNCSVVLWTHNTNDWLKPPAEQIAANALRDIHAGDIILMHQGDAESARALPLIIEGLQARGLRPTTVGEMLSRAPIAAAPIPEIMAKYASHNLGHE